MLSRDFYLRDATSVAPELLGKLLVHKTSEGTASGMIVEVEAYNGAIDKGAHSYPNKRTPRTEIQFGEGGYAYVYSIYGMHCCFNVVTNKTNIPEVVLVRALEPADGIELMMNRRGTRNTLDLCSGPGKLCSALGITKANYGDDLCGDTLFIEERMAVPPNEIAVSPRVNIDYAEEDAKLLWRYFIKDSKFVSKVPKKYAAHATLEDIRRGAIHDRV